MHLANLTLDLYTLCSKTYEHMSEHIPDIGHIWEHIPDIGHLELTFGEAPMYLNSNHLGNKLCLLRKFLLKDKVINSDEK